MEMPRLKTREKNKETHPGVNAGVEKKTRRTAAQMAQVRADEMTSKAKAKLDAQKALKWLAALEDKQREDDLAYAKTANHPADRPLASSAPAGEAADTGGAGGGAGNDPGSGDDSDQYARPEEDTSSSEESESDETEEDDVTQKKKKKKITASRADVIASCKTQDPPGTPAVAVTANAQKKRKAKANDTINKPATKKAKTDKKKSGLDKSVKDRRAPAAPGGDDDSMVAPGGPAVDDDAEEHIERPKSGKKKKGALKAQIIAIQTIAPKPPTRKEARGGTAKWTLQHLPPGTTSEFTDEVVPLARELAGTLAPWMGLTVKQIQHLVDRVFGEGVHEVTAESAWVGLIGYRLTDWRSGLATRGLKAVETLVESYDPDPDDEDANDENEPEVSPPYTATTESAPYTATVGAVPASTVLKFALDTPERIAAFVDWALQPHDSGTMAFHWKTWGEGVDKKGFLQSHLIIYTFAYHLASLATIPGGYVRLDAFPIGALLLSVQAVQHGLQFWKTGEYVNPNKPADHFSIDNWSDTVVASTTNQKKGKMVRRATKFLSTVQKWDAARWNEIKVAAQEWVELPARRRAQTSSRSASEAGDDAMLSDDDVVMVLSD
ncbi:hypothetical protein B0H10DRAFT_2221962 [Mycena sp. CBHHK59/15]|nr:hypothetical protein B0H10DRAFT_2221962 [Mycena sp. CBHHK59/15]